MIINDPSGEATPAALSPTTPPTSPDRFAALGLIAGFGAVVTSSCCVIPLLLAALDAGAGVLRGLELIEDWRVPLLSISGLAISGGWAAWWLNPPIACVSGARCASPQRSHTTLALLLCASITLLAAASWGYIDPVMLKLLRGP